MRQTLDTFTHLLADNLSGVPVRQTRRDPSKPDADKNQINYVNIGIAPATFDIAVSELTVTIDVLHEDELTALEWSEKVWEVLSTRAFTEKLDYTVPSTPVATGGMISWSTKARFRRIINPFYAHFNCRLVLTHHSS